MTDYRYPGSRSFQDTDVDRKLFFGRDKEKEELLHLILAEKLVVVFAKSGMGKTSLLNAGIVQPLRERGFCPINIRLNDPNMTPLQTVYAAIPTPPQPAPDSGEGALAQYFTTTEFWSNDDTLLTPVLIFDQFEELFAFHAPDTRQAMLAQLADTLKNQPALKIIIALREDALGQLKECTAALPDIFRNLFRLDYLPRAQAQQAIIAPAELTDAAIGLTAFQYAPDAVDAMLDFLCKQQQKQNTVLTDEVEPAQLQLLCQHIEQHVRTRQRRAAAAIVVQKNDLGGEKGMQKIVQQFYDRQLKRLRSFWQRRKVRKLCEKGLLSKTNRRLSLAEEDIGRRFRVSPKLLARLIDSRLLRAENRGSGRVYYELSHDTLILPIRKSQRKRKIKNWIVSAMLTILMLLTPMIVVVALLQNYTLARAITTCLRIPEQFGAAGYALLGYTFMTHGKYDEAEEEYRKYAALTPTVWVPYANLGWSLRSQEKYEEAISQYQKALKLAQRFRGHIRI
ncbi:Tfp pilus assembly protein PilF [Candidatus Moduliflexus flocculans]|uniref:Tfp pilus assembly protein PilF n=1 Tax=Candidatus Moduliflexus flocculans TaxID=1499966 RepID=A0A0S6VU07_9BACT|nr:Tfp pilus assembly protein PilF [Candidatus Moduliflexus flocculans]